MSAATAPEPERPASAIGQDALGGEEYLPPGEPIEMSDEEIETLVAQLDAPAKPPVAWAIVDGWLLAPSVGIGVDLSQMSAFLEDMEGHLLCLMHSGAEVTAHIPAEDFARVFASKRLEAHAKAAPPADG